MFDRCFVDHLLQQYKGSGQTNIARGKTDPEIDSVTWTKFGNNRALLASFANLSTRWHWFKILSSAGATCIASQVGHQIALLALPPNGATY